MQYLISLPVLIFSIICHEIAHGYVAYLCGDETAKRAGRLTINPIAHVDLFGSVILPALLVISNAGVVLGWAKPVPINYHYLRNPKRDVIFVALAGVTTNILLAITASVIYKNTTVELIQIICLYTVLYNLFLATFNLVPIPPLDGSRVVSSLLPPQQAYHYSKIEPYGIVVIFLLLYLDMFKYLGVVVQWMFRLLLGS